MVGFVYPFVYSILFTTEPLYQYVNYAQIQSTAIPLKSTGQPSNSSSLQASVYEALGRRRESMSAAPGLGSMKIKLWRELDEVRIDIMHLLMLVLYTYVCH